MKYTNRADATEAAIKLSREKGYAAIVLSRGDYFVEDETPMIRIFEKLIAVYKDGEIVKVD